MYLRGPESEPPGQELKYTYVCMGLVCPCQNYKQVNLLTFALDVQVTADYHIKNFHIFPNHNILRSPVSKVEKEARRLGPRD
jgi:hypothetical protein